MYYTLSRVLLTKFGSHRTFLGKLTSGWPLRDLWPHECITLWSKVLLTKFGSHRTFLGKLTSGWPLRDLWPHKCITLWSRVLLVKFGSRSVTHCRVMQGSAGVNQRSIATKFGRKNPWPKCNALLGSKVMQGSAGVNQRSNCLWNALWPPNLVRKNPWPERNTLLGSKVMQGSAGVNQRSNYLEMPKATKSGQCRFRAY